MRRINLRQLAAIYACTTIILTTPLISQEMALGVPEAKISATISEPLTQHQNEEISTITLTDEQIEHANLETAVADGGKIMMTTCVSGKIVVNPNKYAHVLAKTDGIALDSLKNLGDHVTEGEVLAVMESKEVAETKSAYLAALRREKLAATLLKREEELKEKRISAEQDYLHALAASEEASIELDLTKQKLQTLGITEQEINTLSTASPSDLRLVHLRSPLSGTVIHRHLTKGEVLNTEQEAFIVADLSHVWVEMSIYPKDFNTIKLGQTIEILSDSSSSPTSATITYLSPMIDEETHAVKAIAELDNHMGEWRPGSYVTVNILSHPSAAEIAIPLHAVVSMDGNNIVFVRNPTGFEARQVELGQSDCRNVEILSGLQKGDAYVTKNTFVLKAELTKEPEED